MRKKVALLLALGLLFPAAAQAQWSIGARTGYMRGLGDVDGSAAMSDVVGSQIPIQLDVSYRTDDRLSIGGYFSYGIGFVSGNTKDLCDAAGIDCSGSGLRIGAQMIFNLSPKQQMDPWFGAGFGYESLTADLAGADVTVSGFEFALQGGLDFHASEQFVVGPYAGLSFGQYTDIDGPTGSGELADKKVHMWVTIGVRGEFDF